MKRTIQKLLCNSLLIALSLGVVNSTRAEDSKEPTAFDLIKEGNRHVGEEARDKVMQIRSEKSIASLTPNIWYVVYYDLDAPAKATEVKFGAGQKLAVKRPSRLMELRGAPRLPLERSKLNIDSDKALQMATKDPMLKNLKLVATRLTLERWEDRAAWKVRIWAAKLRNPRRDVDLGEVILSAEDGRVLRNDLHIERVD